MVGHRHTLPAISLAARFVATAAVCQDVCVCAPVCACVCACPRSSKQGCTSAWQTESTTKCYRAGTAVELQDTAPAPPAAGAPNAPLQLSGSASVTAMGPPSINNGFAIAVTHRSATTAQNSNTNHAHEPCPSADARARLVSAVTAQPGQKGGAGDPSSVSK
jgi:hypothetical protein